MIHLFFFPIPLWCYLLCWLVASGLMLWGGMCWHREKEARECTELQLEAAEMECADTSTLKEQFDKLHQQLADTQQRVEMHQALLDTLITTLPDPAWVTGIEGLEEL